MSSVIDRNGKLNSERRLEVVQHASPDSGWIHADFNLTAPVTQDFILIDLSDTANYPHGNTGHLHLEYMSVDIDAAANADYTIQFGFLENVDATNGDFYEFYHISGTKQLGNTFKIQKEFFPVGPRLTTNYLVTSDSSLNDAAFNTATNLASTLNPAVVNTPSGSGDMVMRVTLTGADIVLDFTASYRSHA